MQKTPEIRFEGFEGSWEQRKLSDVLNIATRPNGEQFTKQDVLSVSDEYGCINQIRFQGRSFAGEDISKYKIVKTGDIIYTRSPLQSKPYGIIKIVNNETGIVSPLYIVNEVTEGNDARFVYYVFDSPFKTNNYLNPLVRKGAKNTMNISNEEWLSGNIVVAPEYDEQTKIGEYFAQLDNAITLNRRKAEQYKTLKKYMLQKMFPKNGEKVPEIRFEGFEGNWEQKKLGDVINLYDNKTTVENEFPVLSSTMNGIYLQKEYFNQEVSKVSNIGYKVVPKGYITYRSMSDTDIFRFNVQNIIDFGIVSPAYPVFCGEKNVVDNSFLTYQMNWSNNFLKQLVMSKEGGTRYALSFSKLSKMHVDAPSLSEQTKIGEYFAQLDNAITLHQRKSDEFRILKKYMLQKMFPKQ